MEMLPTDPFSSPQILLTLVSHAHSPPLKPTPQLKYDLRTVPNPPKAIRDAYTGVSKRLRDHMLDHSVFVELLERAEVEIREAMEKVIKTWRVENNAGHEKETKEGEDEPAAKAKSTTEIGVHEDLSGDEGIEGGATEKEEWDEEEVDNRLVLIIGAFCARGQHRSVAFIEELSRKKWSQQCEIRVMHRDLGKERGGEKKNGSRIRQVRGADMFNEE